MTIALKKGALEGIHGEIEGLRRAFESVFELYGEISRTLGREADVIDFINLKSLDNFIFDDLAEGKEIIDKHGVFLEESLQRYYGIEKEIELYARRLEAGAKAKPRPMGRLREAEKGGLPDVKLYKLDFSTEGARIILDRII